jgi:PAS domain S-box-containing protein
MRLQTREFESLLEAMPDGMVGVDPAGVIRFVNRRMESMFGYDPGGLIGVPIETLVPESFRQVHSEHREDYVDAPVQRPMGRDLILSAQRRDGTQFPVDIALSHSDTADGLLVIAAVRDMSDLQDVGNIQLSR